MWVQVAAYGAKKTAGSRPGRWIIGAALALMIVPLLILGLVLAAVTATSSSGAHENSCEPGQGASAGDAVVPTGSKAWPMAPGTYQISSGFGPRDGAMHRGVDFAAPLNTPIYASMDGRVVASDGSDPGGFGWWIVIDSKIGSQMVSTVYGHMYQNTVKVKVGDAVKAGQQIAGVGSNGQSTGPHLHFEVWPNGRLSGGTAIDPQPWLRDAKQPNAPPASAVETAADLVAAVAPADPRDTAIDQDNQSSVESGAGQYDGDGNLAADVQTAAECAFGVAGGGLRPGSVPSELEPWIRKAGSLCPQIPPSLLAAQIGAESGFQRGLTSPDGAMGLTQFMPGTWATWGRDDDGNGKVSPWDDGDAIMAQGRFMCAIAANMDKAIAEKRVNPGADRRAVYLAAYNAGEGAVLSAGGMPSGGQYSTQTQPYAAKILAAEPSYRAAVVGEIEDLPGSSAGVAIVNAARTALGLPYVWGGNGPNSYDCSGLTVMAYSRGTRGKVSLPRTSEQQWSLGREIPVSQARPGDLLFGSWGSNGPGHVAIALGGGRMIHAPTTGDVVREAPIQAGMRARAIV